MDERVLCFIPSEPAFSRLKNLMKEYSIILESNKALLLPPHLTIVPRFQTSKPENLFEEIREYCETLTVFEIEFERIGFFENPAILFLNPKKKNELQNIHNACLKIVMEYRERWSRASFEELKLNEKQRQLLAQYGSPYVKEYYDPHLTLAGPDVNKKLFKELTASFKECTMKVNINELSILKKSNGKWNVEGKIPLGKV